MKSSDVLNSFENIVIDGRMYNISQMSLKELQELKSDIFKKKKDSIEYCKKALENIVIKDDIEKNS